MQTQAIPTPAQDLKVGDTVTLHAQPSFYRGLADHHGKTGTIKEIKEGRMHGSSFPAGGLPTFTAIVKTGEEYMFIPLEHKNGGTAFNSYLYHA